MFQAPETPYQTRGQLHLNLFTPEQPEVMESFGTWLAGHDLFSFLFLLSDAFCTCRCEEKKTTWKHSLFVILDASCVQSVLSYFMQTAGSHKSQEEIWWGAGLHVLLYLVGFTWFVRVTLTWKWTHLWKAGAGLWMNITGMLREWI